MEGTNSVFLVVVRDLEAEHYFLNKEIGMCIVIKSYVRRICGNL